MNESAQFSPGDMPQQKPVHFFTPPQIFEITPQDEPKHGTNPEVPEHTLSGQMLTKAIHRALNGQRPRRKPTKGKGGYYPGKLVDMSAPLYD